VPEADALLQSRAVPGFAVGIAIVRRNIPMSGLFSMAPKVRAGIADRVAMSTISSALPSVIPSSASSSGLAALSTGQQELAQDGMQIANPDNANNTAALLNLQQSNALTGAAADVIETSNQMMGTLLNVFA
jgi:hypothetical protein